MSDSESEVIKSLEKAIRRISGRRVAVQSSSDLREDLGLDSMNLIELAVWIHEEFGVNLGKIADEQGKIFRTIGDLLKEIMPKVGTG